MTVNRAIHELMTCTPMTASLLASVPAGRDGKPGCGTALVAHTARTHEETVAAGTPASHTDAAEIHSRQRLVALLLALFVAAAALVAVPHRALASDRVTTGTAYAVLTSEQQSVAGKTYPANSLIFLRLNAAPAADATQVTDVCGQTWKVSQFWTGFENTVDAGNSTDWPWRRTVNSVMPCSTVVYVAVAPGQSIRPTACSRMFSGFATCTSMDLAGLDTSAATGMYRMFADSGEITSLDLSGFDTSSVTDMAWMFEHCFKLERIDLSSFDTSNVTNMDGMFNVCHALESLDLSSFNTSKVQSMYATFVGLTQVTSLDLSGFDTSSLVQTLFLFSGCTNLVSLDISSFDTSHLGGPSALSISGKGDYGSEFTDCTSLKWLRLPETNPFVDQGAGGMMEVPPTFADNGSSSLVQVASLDDTLVEGYSASSGLTASSLTSNEGYHGGTYVASTSLDSLHAVTVDDGDEAVTSASSGGAHLVGDTVTVRVNVAAGYTPKLRAVAGITNSDITEHSNGVFTFVMPDKGVRVRAYGDEAPDIILSAVWGNIWMKAKSGSTPVTITGASYNGAPQVGDTLTAAVNTANVEYWYYKYDDGNGGLLSTPVATQTTVDATTEALRPWYVWYRDGVEIPNSGSRTGKYTVTAQDAAHQLSVEVFDKPLDTDASTDHFLTIGEMNAAYTAAGQSLTVPSGHAAITGSASAKTYGIQWALSNSNKTLTLSSTNAATSNILPASFASAAAVPWNSARSTIDTLTISNSVMPYSMAYWFTNMTKLTTADLTNVGTSLLVGTQASPTGATSLFEGSGLTSIKLPASWAAGTVAKQALSTLPATISGDNTGRWEWSKTIANAIPSTYVAYMPSQLATSFVADKAGTWIREVKRTVTVTPQAGIASGSVKIGGTATTTAKVQPGTTVNLAATLANGYQNIAWSTSDATLSASSGASTSFAMPGKNVAVTVGASTVTYTISYDLNKPSNAPANPSHSGNNPATYLVTDATFTIADPSCTGFDFAGWTLSLPNGGALASGSSASGATGFKIAQGSYGNVKLTANWTAADYPLTLDYHYSDDYYNGRSNYAETGYVPNFAKDLSIAASYNLRGEATERYSLLATYLEPEVNNMAIEILHARLRTWLCKDGNSNPYDSSSYASSSLDTLTAGKDFALNFGWTAASRSYLTTVSGAATSGDADRNTLSTAKYPNGDQPALTQSGLSIKVGRDTRSDIFSPLVVNGLTITAPVTYDTGLPLPAAPTRIGHSFKGWFTAATNGTQVTTSTKMGAAAVTYHAQWTPNTYTVAYNLDGGSHGASHPSSATWNTAFTVSAPTRTGYDFAGWNVTGLDASRHYNGSAETTGTSIAATKQTSFKNLTATQGATVTFTATWTPHSAEVTFQKSATDATLSDLTVTPTSPVGSGLVVSNGTTARLTYDVTYTLAGTITRDYHSFHGWNTTQNAQAASTASGWTSNWDSETGAFTSTIRNVTTGTSATNAYAVWTRNAYNVTYAPGEGGTQSSAVSQANLVAGSSYTVKPLSETNISAKPGYYFVGWTASVSERGAILASGLPERLLGSTTLTTGLVAPNSADGVTVTLTAEWGVELTAVWADVTLQDAKDATGSARDTTNNPHGVLLKVGGNALKSAPIYGQTITAELNYAGVRGYYFAYHSDDNGNISIDSAPTYATISATEEPIDPYYTWYRNGTKIAARSGKGSSYSSYKLDSLDDIGKTFYVVVTDVHDDATADEVAAAAGQYLGKVTSATTATSQGYYDITLPSGTGIAGVTVTQDGNSVTTSNNKATVLTTTTAKVTVTPATGYHLTWATKPSAIAGDWTTANTIGANATDTATAEFTMPAASFAIALGTNIGTTGNSYTVAYDKNTTATVGNMPASTPAVYDANVTLPSTEPTRAGYTFKGWSRTQGATTAEYSKGQVLTKPNFKSITGQTQTLYAVWEAKTDTTVTVYHYLQDLSGDKKSRGTTYTVEVAAGAQTTGTSDATVTPANYKKAITGFTYEKSFAYKTAPSALTSGTPSGGATTSIVEPDGSTKIYVYYTRDLYTQTYQAQWQYADGLYYDAESGSTTKAYKTQLTEQIPYQGTASGWSYTPSNAAMYNAASIASYTNVTSTNTKQVQVTRKAYAVTVTNGTGVRAGVGKTVTSGASNGTADTYYYGTVLTFAPQVATGYMTPYRYTPADADASTHRYTVTATKAFTVSATPISYSVRYDKNSEYADGSMDVQGPLTYDVTFTLAKNAYTRTGYTFGGWDTLAAGTGTRYADEQEVSNLWTTNSGIRVLYAVWNIKAHKLTVTDDTGVATSVKVGGSNFSNGSDADYNNGVSIDYTLTPGYKFDGWTWKNGTNGSLTNASSWTWGGDNANGSRLSGTGSSAKPLAFVMPDNDVAITANASPIAYTISYDLNKGTGSTTPQHGTTHPAGYDVEDAAINVSAPTRTGYTFTGWTVTTAPAHWGDGSTTSGKNVRIATGTYGNIALKANWTPNTYTVSYQPGTPARTQNAVSMPASPTTTGTFDTSFAVAAPTLEGYTFDGWDISGLAHDGTIYVGTSAMSTTAPAGNTSLSAGTTTHTVAAGKTHLGNLRTEAGTVTFTARWVANTYDLSFEGGASTVTGDMPTITAETGGTPASVNASEGKATLTYDVTYTIANNYRRTGYTFVGWLIDGASGNYLRGERIEDAQGRLTGLKVRNVANGQTVTGVDLVTDWQANIYNVSITAASTGIASVDGDAGSTATSGPAASALAKGASRSWVYTYSDTDAAAGGYRHVTVRAQAAPGYENIVWKRGGTQVATGASYDFDLPASDVALSVEVSQRSYAISYDLNGNVASTVAGTTTPQHAAGTGTTTTTSYQVEDATFTVARPTRTGYDFVGWQIITPATHWASAPVTTTSSVTWAGSTSSVSTVADLTVATGSYGDIALKAIWRPRNDTKVTVKYYLRDLNATANQLKGSYTLQSSATIAPATNTTDATVSLSDSKYAKSFTGYELDSDPYRATDGGTGKGGAANATTFKVSADGTSTISIYYRPTLYSFTLGQATPAYAATTTGSTPSGAKAYYYGATITLVGASTTGYTWSQWQAGGQAVANFQNRASTSFAMPAGDVSMTPVVTANKYGISFADNAPTDAPTSDPANMPANISETPESAPRYDAEYALPANVPTRLGYDFTGWALSDTAGTSYKISYDKAAAANARWSMAYTSGAKSGQSLYAGVAAPRIPATVHLANGVAGSMTGTLTAQWTTKTGYTVRYDANAQDPETGVYDTTIAKRTDLAGSVSWTQTGLVGANDSYARTGYSFTGWYTARTGGTKVTPTHTYGTLANIQVSSGAADGGDSQRTTITLYAQWTPNVPTVTFDANVAAGAVGKEDTAVSMTIGHTTYTITYDEAGTPTATGSAQLTSDEVSKVTGTQSHTARLTYDITYTIETTAYRPYFTFLGWATSADATTPTWKDERGLRLDGTAIDSEVTTDSEFNDLLATGSAHTVYAVWQQHAYHVRYVSGDDAGNIAQVGVRQSGLLAGNSYTLLSAAAANLTPPAGRTLAGYRIEVSGGVDAEGRACQAAPNSHITYTTGGYVAAGSTLDFGLVDTESTGALVTLHAVWEGSARTIGFDANGAGATVAPATRVYLGATDSFAADDLPTPLRSGYRFDGWFTDPVAGSQLHAGDAVPKADTTYYAHWTPETYVITIDLASGTLLADGWTKAAGSVERYTMSYTVESEDIALPGAAGVGRHGYDFAGWTGEGLGSATTSVTVATGSTGDRHYTASWTPRSYVVSFERNVAAGDAAPVTGTMGAQAGLAYGESHVLRANAFARTGHVFAGWAFDAAATTPVLADGATLTDATIAGHDEGGIVTLYAVWVPEDAGRTDGTAYAVLATEAGTLANGRAYEAGTLLFVRSFGSYEAAEQPQVLTDVEGTEHVGYVFAGVESQAWAGDEVPWRTERDIERIVAVLAPASQTVAPVAMSHWFDGCGELTQVELAGFDTSAVTDMAGLFYGCVKLSSADLSGIDTRAAVTLEDLFARCDALVAVRLGETFAFKGANVGEIARDADLQAALPETATTAAVPDTGWITPDGMRTTNGAMRTAYADASQPGWYRRASEADKATLVLVVPGQSDTLLVLDAGTRIADAEALVEAAGVPTNLEVTSWHTDEALAATSAVDFGQDGYPAEGLAAGSVTTLYAKVAARGFELTLEAGTGVMGGALLRGAGTYPAGSTVYVQATPAAGYEQVRWADAAMTGAVTPTDGTGDMAGWQRLVMPERDVTLTATAAPATFEITLANGGADAGVTNADRATAKVFETYATGVYLPNAAGTAASATAVAASGTANLTVPAAAWTVTYDLAGGSLAGGTSASVSRGFGGYYTDENGRGTQLVAANGLLVANAWKGGATAATRFAGAATLHAKWTNGSLTLPEPTRADYDFMGWTLTDGAAEGELAANTSYTPAGNVTLHATWRATRYAITYDLDGGKLPTGVSNPESYTAFDSFTLVNPSKQGATFGGWTCSGLGLSRKETVVVAAGSARADLSFRANWSSFAGEDYLVTITIDAHSTLPASETVHDALTALPGSAATASLAYDEWYLTGETDATQDASATRSYTLLHNNRTALTLPTPEWRGRTLQGWTGESLAGVTREVSIAAGSTGDLSFFAVGFGAGKSWDYSEYVVRFHAASAAGEEGDQTDTQLITWHEGTLSAASAPALKANAFTRAYDVTFDYNGGTDANLATELTRSASATFAHWRRGTGTTTYEDGQKITGNLTDRPETVELWAQWTAGSVALPTPTRAGFELAGWSLVPAGGEVAVQAQGGSYTPASSLTLYAQWTPALVSVTFDPNAGSITTVASGTLSGGKATMQSYAGYPVGNATGNLIVGADGAPATDEHGAVASLTLGEAVPGGRAITLTRPRATANGWSYEVAGRTSDTGVYTLTLLAKGLGTWNVGQAGNGTIAGLALDDAYALYSKSYVADSPAAALGLLNRDAYQDGVTNCLQFAIPVLQDGALAALPVAERTGYAFAGWYTDKGVSADPTAGTRVDSTVALGTGVTGRVASAATTSVLTPERNSSYFARWTPNTYKVRFDGNADYPMGPEVEGTMLALNRNTPVTGHMDAQPMTYDAPAALATHGFVKRGYEFVGWNTKADGTGAKFGSATGAAAANYAENEVVSNLTAAEADVTLWAQWRQTNVAGSAYAVFDESGTLTFLRSEQEDPTGTNTTVVDIAGVRHTGDVYAIDESSASDPYASVAQVPWAARMGQLRQVRVADYPAGVGGDKQLVAPVSMGHWFDGASGVTAIDLEGIDTSSVTNMAGLFAGCAKLTSGTLSLGGGFATGEVTSMERMFAGCASLTGLDLSGLDTAKVASMASMFDGCSALVTVAPANEVAEGDAVPGVAGSGWTTAAVTSMRRMFAGCASLERLDVSAWDTSRVTTMEELFDGCSGLRLLAFTRLLGSTGPEEPADEGSAGKVVDATATRWRTGEATDMAGMFCGCARLGYLDLRCFDTHKVADLGGMFEGCARLSMVDLGANFSFLPCVASYDPNPNPKTGLRDNPDDRKAVLPEPPADSIYSGGWAYASSQTGAEVVSALYLREHYGEAGGAYQAGTYLWPHYLPVAGGEGDNVAVAWMAVIAVAVGAAAVRRRRHRRSAS